MSSAYASGLSVRFSPVCRMQPDNALPYLRIFPEISFPKASKACYNK